MFATISMRIMPKNTRQVKGNFSTISQKILYETVKIFDEMIKKSDEMVSRATLWHAWSRTKTATHSNIPCRTISVCWPLAARAMLSSTTD